MTSCDVIVDKLRCCRMLIEDKQVWCYSEITYTFSSQTIVTGDGNAVYHFLFANEGVSTITSRVAFPNLLRIHPESTPFCFWIEMTGIIPHISKNILKITIFSKYIILSYKYLSYGIKSFWALHFTFKMLASHLWLSVISVTISIVTLCDLWL